MLPAADLYDLVYGAKDYAREAEAIDTLVRDLSPTAVTLLDVGCGTGRHLSHLASRYTVAGLDNSPELLEGARRRLPEATFYEADMRTFDLDKTFDVVTCLFSAIGYAGDEEGTRSAIKRMAAHVASGGVLVIEPWLTPNAFEDGHVTMDVAEDNEVKVARACVSERQGAHSRLVFTYLVATPSGAEAFTEVHELGLLPTELLVDAVRSSGLEPTFHENGLSGRGIVVGRRT